MPGTLKVCDSSRRPAPEVALRSPLRSDDSGVDYSWESDMAPRWEALFGIVNGAVLFVPVLLAIFVAPVAIQARRAAQASRIAEYRASPLSRLLILND